MAISTNGILFAIILLIFSETSITIPIGANNANITPNVAKYFFRMYLSIIVNFIIYSYEVRDTKLEIKGLHFPLLTTFF